MHETRYSRNPLVVRVLAELGWMRELGVGVGGILDSMGEADAHYSIFRKFGSDHTRLTLTWQRGRGGGA